MIWQLNWIRVFFTNLEDFIEAENEYMSTCLSIAVGFELYEETASEDYALILQDILPETQRVQWKNVSKVIGIIIPN